MAAIDEIDTTPPVVIVREADDFRQRPLATLGNALEGAAGVMVQQSTYGQASPFLRGLTGYQVLNLIDGVRFNNATFRSGPNQYLAFADPSQVRRIEAMLGPASSQFGSDAMGGAIQVLTPDAGFNTGSSRMLSARANLFGAGADESMGGDATVLARGRNMSGMVGVARRSLKDLRAGRARDSHQVLRRFFGLTDEQIRDVSGDRQIDTGFVQSSLQAKLAARPGRQQNLTVWYQRSEQEDVRGYKDLWGGLGRLQSDFDPQRLQFLYARYERLGVGRLDWVSGTFSVNSQDDGSVRQGLRATDRIIRDNVGVDAFGYTVQAGMHADGRHALVFGGEIYDEYMDARRDETDPRTGTIEQKRPLYPNGSRYRTSGVFVQDVVDLVRGDDGPKLAAHLGGRFTYVDVRTYADLNRSDSGQSFGVVDSELDYRDWTFNAGLRWEATRVLGFNVLVGRGFRAPNLNDLGALGLNDLGYEVPAESAIDAGARLGASDGEGVLSAGRPVASLKSERLFNYELGTTVNWGRLHGRIQAFDAELYQPHRQTYAPLPDRQPAVDAGRHSGHTDRSDYRAAGTRRRQRGNGARPPSSQGLRQRRPGALLRARDAPSLPGFDALVHGSHLLVPRGERPQPDASGPPTSPQQGSVALRYQPSGLVSWIEASALFSGTQELLINVVLALAELREVVERAGGLQLLDGRGARLHLLGLVLRALDREAEVGHLLAYAVGCLGDLHLRLGGRVLRLDDLLLRPEGLDLRAQLLLVLGQRLLLALELLHLRVERLELGLGDRLALERGAGQVLAALRERLAGLRVELDDLLLELVGLHLEALLRRRDVGDALLDVLEQLQLLVVAVVERLGRVLGTVEGLRDLRLYDRGHATGEPSHVASFALEKR